jgi:RNA polymerase sigma-70 factor, ECF subfamily
MAHKRYRDDPEGQVVQAAEPFESFFRREFPRMVAIAYGISGSRWAAEELAQEALLRAFRAWPDVSKYDKPGAWLRRVTINLCSSLLRRRVSELKALERFAFSSVEPIDPMVGEDSRFWDEVKLLPRRQREVVVLRSVDDMTTPDIATVLGISESAVRTHLQRAREALMQKLVLGGSE